MVSIKLTSGKAEFVKRKVGDKIIEVCLNKYNADFSFNCMGQVHGGNLIEVINNNGAYSKGSIQIYRKKGIYDCRCFYCFAKLLGGKKGRRGNLGKVTPKTIGKRTREEFEKYQPKIIRLGKLTECGHPFYVPLFMDYLELCEEFGSRVIMINKMLPFGKQGIRSINLPRELKKKIPVGEKIAEKFKETNSVIHYSLGWDDLEIGACSQGFTNKWRIQQAERFYKERVNTTLTSVCDVTGSIKKNVGQGSSIRDVLKSREKTGITFRIIPVRIISKKVAPKITGFDWEVLQNPFINYLFPDGKVLEDLRQKYRRRGDSQLVPMYFHPDFQSLINEGIGVCGNVGNYEYCDKCNLFGDERIVFPVSELVKVKYDRAERGGKLKDKTLNLFLDQI